MNEKIHEIITQVCQEHVPKKRSGTRRKEVVEDRKRMMTIRIRTLKKIDRDGPSHRRRRKLVEIEEKKNLQLSHKKKSLKVVKSIFRACDT